MYPGGQGVIGSVKALVLVTGLILGALVAPSVAQPALASTAATECMVAAPQLPVSPVVTADHSTPAVPCSMDGCQASTGGCSNFQSAGSAVAGSTPAIVAAPSSGPAHLIAERNALPGSANQRPILPPPRNIS